MGETTTQELPPLSHVGEADDSKLVDEGNTVDEGKAVKKKKKLKPNGADHPLETRGQRAELMFPHLDGNKLLATIENMRVLLNYYQIVCRYNVISKRNLHIVPGETFSAENEEESALACIFSRMKEWKLPVDGYKMYLTRIADQHQYNPVLEWVESKPWDGISRLPEFYDTITSPETEAKELLLRRWLITAMCMAIGEGVDSAGCLVLQGPQDLGKTWWAKKLVPENIRNALVRTDATVDPKDKDSVSQVISYWLVELGEIGATFRKADLDALKAFITRDHDIMRRPYGEGDKHYPRRTAFIASVDQFIYLHDTAGNRRFWTIPCTAINSYHEIDMQQLWAEVLVLVKGQKDGQGNWIVEPETWRLAPDEKEHIRRINEEHMQIDPIYEMLLDKYAWTTPNTELKSATQIASELGLRNITQKETRAISSYAMKLGAEKENGGQKRLKIPFTRPF